MRYARTAIADELRSKGRKSKLSYDDFTDALESLADGFKKWGKKKPGRYKAFFNIIGNEV